MAEDVLEVHLEELGQHSWWKAATFPAMRAPGRS